MELKKAERAREILSSIQKCEEVIDFLENWNYNRRIIFTSDDKFPPAIPYQNNINNLMVDFYERKVKKLKKELQKL